VAFAIPLLHLFLLVLLVYECITWIGGKTVENVLVSMTSFTFVS